jgi:hypothetical protein
MTREPSMAELKKRAALMLDIIAQSQVEMARAESRRISRDENGAPGSPGDARTPEQQQSDNGATTVAASLAGELATRLVKWQHEFTVEGGAAALVEAAGRARG